MYIRLRLPQAIDLISARAIVQVRAGQLASRRQTTSNEIVFIARSRGNWSVSRVLRMSVCIAAKQR
jgi:hypothetical protein